MHKIDIDDLSDAEIDEIEITKKLLTKKPTNICYTSIWRITAVITTVFVLLSVAFLLRYYMKFLLLWLEHQDGTVKMTTVVILFCIVALPISIGYLVLVCTSGYLYGFCLGLPLVVFGANFGLLIANIILKNLGHHPTVLRLTENPTAQAIKRLISGPSSFKIVLCARVTPIPFGLQNTIFAVSFFECIDCVFFFLVLVKILDFISGYPFIYIEMCRICNLFHLFTNRNFLQKSKLEFNTFIEINLHKSPGST